MVERKVEKKTNFFFQNFCPTQQREIDQFMLQLDGTENKGNIFLPEKISKLCGFFIRRTHRCFGDIRSFHRNMDKIVLTEPFSLKRNKQDNFQCKCNT